MASIEVDKDLFDVLKSKGLEAAIKFSENRSLAMLQSRGVTITQELKEYAIRNAVTEVKSLTAKIRNANLSSNLVKLLDAGNKRKAQRIAERDLVLQDQELSDLIGQAHLYGYEYRCKHKEFRPADLAVPSVHDLAKADPETGKFTREGKKAFNRIQAIFAQRRILHVHWFQFGLEWHCFFFDRSDLMGGHWSEGDHIHYLSHLWGLSSDEVWNGFEDRNYSPGKVHIRFTHDLRQSGQPLRRK